MKYLICFLLIILSCNNTAINNHESIIINKNNSLPKDIVLDKNVSQIIDSSFIVENDSLELRSVAFYYVDNKILTSKTSKHYMNKTLTSVYNKYCDENGNDTLDIDSILTRNTILIKRKKRDKYGNEISSQFKENNYESGFIIKNEYKNNQLISFTKNINSGILFEKVEFQYDSNGNIIEKKQFTPTFGSKTSIVRNSYNTNNQVVLTIGEINGKKSDSTIYAYENTLLIRKERYDLIDGNYYLNYKVEYNYDSDNHLIEEKIGSENKKYINYDFLGNWSTRESYMNERLNYIIKRNVIL